MKFGPVPVQSALGAILAHSVQVAGKRLRKGRILETADLDRLVAAGISNVTVARLEPGDLHEDTAAELIAVALAAEAQGTNVRGTRAATGRVNLYSTCNGVFEIDAAAVAEANRVDPMITLATLAPFAPVRDGTMVGTVKIIAYGVPETAAKTAARLASRAVRVCPVIVQTATLIITDTGSGPGKGEEATRARLAALGIDLASVRVVPHDISALSQAVAVATSDLVLVLTGSATSDPMDVGPEAVRAAGGQVTRFGMPVDPGNLLFLGQQGGRPVIGLPGCARSPALNGADWVLERVACGLEVTDADIAAMGVGGLLKESPARPHPREKR